MCWVSSAIEWVQDARARARTSTSLRYLHLSTLPRAGYRCTHEHTGAGTRVHTPPSLMPTGAAAAGKAYGVLNKRRATILGAPLPFGVPLV